MGLDIVSLLSEGDKRTVNNVDTVVAYTLKDNQAADVLVACLRSRDEGLAMRAADALEKVFAKQPGLLTPYTSQLVKTLLSCSQKEVQWHLAQILPSMPLTKDQTSQAAKIWIDNFYHSKSSIVRTFSLQAMHDVSGNNPDLRSVYEGMISYALAKGTPAMKSRAKILLDESA